MEDPVRFDVWAKPVGARRRQVLVALRQSRPLESELEVRKALNTALGAGKSVVLAKSLTYSQALQLMGESSTEFSDFDLCQEGYQVEEAQNFCTEHALHFGGCLGCHVCNGFYVV